MVIILKVLLTPFPRSHALRGILGADIFINLLLVFIVTTGLLLMNTNKFGNNGEIAQKEKKLFKIDLPKGSSKGLPGGKPENTATLSTKYTGKDVQYFMDNSRVKFNELTK